MTPDLALKAAILGADDISEPPGETAPKPPRKKIARAGRPVWLRWTIRIMSIALILLVTQGLMKTPKVKAMIAQATEAVMNVVRKEQVARAETTGETSAHSMPQGGETRVAVSAMPQDRVTVLRPDPQTPPVVNTLQETGSGISGQVTAIHAANLIDVAGQTLLLEGIVCPAPETEAGRLAALGLARLTQAKSVTCTETGALGEHAKTGTCEIETGQDLGNALRAAGLCQ